MRVFRFFIFFGGLIGSKPVFSQHVFISQNTYWMRYYTRLALSTVSQLHVEAEPRRFISPNEAYQFGSHLHFRRSLNSGTQVALGLSYFRHHAPNPALKKTVTVPERRLFQEVLTEQGLGNGWRLSHRYRLDERFFRNNDGTNLQDGYRFNARFRYRVQLSKSLKNKWNFKLADELMVNAGKNVQRNFFDQNRIYIGTETALSSDLSLELGYMKLLQLQANGMDFYDRNVLRLTVYHQTRLYK